MKLILTTILISSCLSAFCQPNPTEQAKPIVEEGKRLYRSEMASWYGTDVFMEKYTNKENIGSYFSYIDNGVAKCVFFSKAEKPKVIGTISFDSTYNVNTAKADLVERDFTAFEFQMYSIRKAAADAIEVDSFFQSYNNTQLNLVPMIDGKEKKLYILTGTSQNGVVIFGNDYLLTFDNDNNITSKKRLHKNILPVSYGEITKEGEEPVGGIHSHLPETGDFMTATDICTLMLYEKFTKWKQYTVVSEKYLNIWNCLTDELLVIPMGTIDKIQKDADKRKKDKKND